jgi:MFS family permease
MAGFGVACVLTIPFLHGIIAALGRRGALMAATISLAIAAAAFAVIAPVGAGAIFLRASEGVTWTIMFSTALTLTAEMAPLGRLAQAIGLAGAASLIMNAVAPAIGEPIADRFGYRAVFVLAAVAALVAAALAKRLPETHPGDVERVADRPAANAAQTGDGDGDGASDDVAARADRFRMYVVFALAGLAFSVLFTFLAPFALDHGVRVISTFFVAYTGSALTLRVLGGRLADRLGHRTIAAYALLLYGLVVASTGLLGPHRLALLGIGFGLAHGAAFPAMMALLINSASARKRPRVLGIANGAMSVGISAVFPAGTVVARLGYPVVFAIAGGLVAASSLLIRARRARRA